VLAWFVLVGATLNFFLAGLAVFRAKPHGTDKLFQSSSFDAHRVLGYAVILVAFALLVLAVVNREQIRLAFLLFALMLLQYALAAAGDTIAALGALHPVNGVLILLVSYQLAQGPDRARKERRRRRKRPDEEPASAEPARS
jgi:uncharacterized membrane protein